MIKAIFFDIDGTLLSYNTHRVLDSTIEAFDALHRKGILTIISSGRPLMLIPKMPVAFDGYITVNGGYCFVGDKVLLRNPINNDDAQKWLHYVEQNNLTTMCFTEHEMFINQIDPVAQQLRDQLDFEMPPLRPLSEFKGCETYQFIAVQPADKDPYVLQLLSHCRMPRWHSLFSDIVPQGSSKAVGMEHILRHYGISHDDTVAFGDGANDIEMLDYADIGVAMGNASETVKKHADYVTSDSDSDGIANALKHLDII